MTKSRRAKVVHLTKTTKKGRENKARLIDQIKEYAIPTNHIYLFQVQNMRNQLFKDVRMALPEGRFFIGKNRVMAKALVQIPLPGLNHLTSRLRGDRGLLFAPVAPDQIQRLFDCNEASDFARTGNRAAFTVIIEDDPEGLRNISTGERLPATVESQLRQAGMPTKLRGGAVLLAGVESFEVCREGEVLTPEAARILKTFGIKMAEFKVCLVAHYFDGTFEEYEVEDNEAGETPNIEADSGNDSEIDYEN